MKLTIPTPCSEDWDGMTPTACGRFCAVCQKEVIDISHMDDNAILQKYLENDGKLCVQARTEQISPTVRERTYPMQRLAVFALAVWLAFAGSLVLEVQAQTDSLEAVYRSQFAILKVKVNDKDQKPVANAHITLVKDHIYIIEVIADEAGTAVIDYLEEGIYIVKVQAGEETIKKAVNLYPNRVKQISVQFHTAILELPRKEVLFLRGKLDMTDAIRHLPVNTLTKRYEFDLNGKSYWVDR